MSIIRGKKIDGRISKRSCRRKKQTKVIKMKGFAQRSKPTVNINDFKSITVTLNLTEADVKNALNSKVIRIHGVLYDVPVIQLQGVLASKKFGPVALTLIKAESQELPVDPNAKNDTTSN